MIMTPKAIIGLVSFAILACLVKSNEDDLDLRDMARQLKALKTEVKHLKFFTHLRHFCKLQKVYIDIAQSNFVYSMDFFSGKQRSKKFMLVDNAVEGPIAFSSYISNYQDGLAPHKTLTFDSTILNDGNAYNNHTGIFTSPVNGVYLVSFFIADRNINQVFVQLTVDNTVVSTACAETIQNRHIDQGGNVVLVRLTKGQNIGVEVLTGNAHIESHTAWRFTTFSAVLLYEYEL